MIRAMEPKDLPVVMHIWLDGNCQAHSFIPKTYWEKNFKDVEKVLPESEVYVAEENGEIAGFIGMGSNNYVEGLFVAEQCRSKGIGKQLLDFVKADRQILRLCVYQENTRAVSFYLREGFRVLSEYDGIPQKRREYTMEWNNIKNYKNYNITTQFKLLSEDKQESKIIYVNEDTVDMCIRVTYQSDIPFQVKLQMLDNYVLGDFEIKQAEQYDISDSFTLDFKETNGKFLIAEFYLRLHIAPQSMHDIVFLMKNLTKINSGSAKAYDFLRLGINLTPTSHETLLHKENKIDFSAGSLQEPQGAFLQITTQQAEEQVCTELSLDFEKIYDADLYRAEYTAHENQEIQFIVLCFREDKVFPVNQGNAYLWCNARLGEKGKVRFSMPNNSCANGEQLVLVIPYPYLSYDLSDRYQKLAYNYICYNYITFPAYYCID